MTIVSYTESMIMALIAASEISNKAKRMQTVERLARLLVEDLQQEILHAHRN